MKNIKKFLTVTFALLMTLTFTGCEQKYEKSKLKPEEALAKSGIVAKEVENYKISMDMLISATTEYNGATVSTDMKMSTKGIYDEKNKKAHMNMDIDVLGIKTSAEAYVEYDEENQLMNTYTKVGDIWQKVTESYSVGSDNTILVLQDGIKEGVDIKEVAADKNNYNYVATINKESAQKILSASNTDDSTSDLLTLLSDTLKLEYSLDKETYQISRIYIDMTDMLNKAVTGDVKYTKASFEIKLSDFNKSGNVTIPKEVKENLN